MRRKLKSRRNCSLMTTSTRIQGRLMGTGLRFIFRALALAVTVRLLSVRASSASDQNGNRGAGLVFRVEGFKDDPEFERACCVVKSLEELYGKESYILQAKAHAPKLEHQQNFPRRWRRVLSRLLCGERGKSSPEQAVQHTAVLCSISQAPSASARADGRTEADVDLAAPPVDVQESVPIGGAEELLTFVRTSVLAGPRPYSFAFHERSLRVQKEQRGRKRIGDVTSARSSSGGLDANHELRDSTGARSSADASCNSGTDNPRTSPSGVVSAPGFPEYDYDLVVIGGGSGGLACAKEAARLGQRVACLDFVKPSPMGTKWGLGGTCVNVGCIPKKLMHQASLIGGHLKDAEAYGWRLGHKNSSIHEGHSISSHDWQIMVRAVQGYIKGLNFKYRADLRSKGVEYLNALGRLEDPKTVVATTAGGRERVLKCRKVVVAVGGRPKPLICEGGDLAMTSDDLFSASPPGKTLVVGASYVALECAGFLTGLGIDTTVMVRSVLLRGFDQDIAERIGRFMQAEGTRFIRPAVPRRISKTKEGRLLVAWEEGEEEFDTVLTATGRTADVQGLGLENIGVAFSEGGKIITNNEETTVPGVFGVGDVVEGVPELTPAAVQAGKLLARRLFGGSAEAMDYRNVCTTVFTPLEYSSCGLSEDDAIDQLGQENVNVYHSAFTPLEWDLNPERPKNACYIKAVCDLADRHRVVGLHFLGPNAGEVMQGFGVGFRLGMTYDDLRQLVGIHPTAAEELTLLQITKRSGEPIEKSSC